MKTFNPNTHPNFFNLCNTNEVCNTKDITVNGESLHTLIQGIHQEAFKLMDTHVEVFNPTDHPYLCKLWDMFYNNMFQGITLYNEDYDTTEDFNSMVEQALMEMVLFYV